MRKLKLQVQMSTDGFIGGPNGEMDWLEWNWDDELKNYIGEITNPVDCIVLGRKLAEGFIPYWAAVAENADDPQYEAGKKFTQTPKVVFSKTLHESQWDNTKLAEDGIAEEINKLKQQEGGDIIAYGGAAFVSDLIKHRLIDDFYLLINPTAIGSGKPIFKSLSQKQQFNLVEAKSFACGIVALHYTLKRSY